MWANQMKRETKPTVRGSVVKWNESSFVLSVHIGPVLQQELGHFEVVVAGSQVQGGAVAALEGRRRILGGCTKTGPVRSQSMIWQLPQLNSHLVVMSD